MSVHAPSSEKDCAAIVREAAARGATLEIRGGGSKAGLGRPVTADAVLNLTHLTGIVTYEPDEMVLIVRAGAPLTQVEAVLAGRGQRLAFEPPDLGPFHGGPPRAATIGGVIAANLAGPRRPFAGGPRDHLLGLRAVTGTGEVLRMGSRVMKNVTGFDLPKLACGQMGTLFAATELTLRVAPAPQAEITLAVFGLSDGQALALMGRAAALPVRISGAAHLPAETAARIDLGALREGGAATVLRLEGAPGPLAERAAALERLLPRGAARTRLEGADSAGLWRAIRDLKPFSGSGHDVWRIGVPPAQAASLVAGIGPALALYDWAGARVVLGLPPSPRAEEDLVRRVAAEHGGEAVLIRAPADVRRTVAPFAPPEGPRAAIEARLKAAFDPVGILSPGRMVEGV